MSIGQAGGEAPYTRRAWARIDALGEAVDARLHANDVRLTMGGEPTFVALDDPHSPQWRVEADGEHKRLLANVLAERLRSVYAEGGVVHRGQGKWYPGESHPRWSIALQWRTDGEPLWRHPELFADPWSTDAPTARDAAAGAAANAEALARRVTELLGLPPSQLLPAFDDPLAELAAELRRPAGPRPGTDGFDRDAIEALERGDAPPAGWVLPLTTDAGRWMSPAWRFRRGRLVLLRGPSPLGMRLPLDAVSWTDPEWSEPSYLEAGPPLDPGLPSVAVVDPDGARTTALAVEARDGHVHVFLPPTQELEAYADLLLVVERAATDASCRIVLEGYGPPPDARVRQLVVTPDPGVVEVNLQPMSSWAEQRDLMLTLFGAARDARLGASKLDRDGARLPTGGGNHITLGGAQPIDSPVLRRPDLLPSLLRCWQRHPGLTYLFSGRFVGPTSQAPRFDEGRPEAVYEMEIALAEIERLTRAAHGGSLLPWVVDRSLRHLLTDLTGNTHRSEFCVDKLYSPDTSRGRLGILELRGFEMPPHAELALVQSLLVRSLVAMYWEEPCTDPLVEWGARLHDDFLLPEGAMRDVREVVAELQAHGIAFDAEWLEPFAELRFPLIGTTRIAGGIELELRHAIEPWRVLGEEAGATGTARYVDSSTQRLQVLVRGADADRHVVTCNGVPVPLAETGRAGELYAGVRYRARQPWSALHPMIPVHAPLSFDVVDTETAASLGGARAHVEDPSGAAYRHPPVDEEDAAARRARRFEPRGPASGTVDVSALRDRARRAADPDHPRTLDLRRTSQL